MDQPTLSKDHARDRIKLPFNFDAERLLAEINELNLQQFHYYNVIQLRAPAHLVDTSLPFPPPADDYADGTWTKWLDTAYLEKLPYLNEVLGIFKEHATVNLVRLLRLEAGAVVAEHTDPTLGLHIEKSMVRVTIPIKTNDAVEFYLNDTIVPMQPGECWYLRLTDKHRIVNNSMEERINLTIDIIPNDWFRKLIAECDYLL